MRITVIGDGGWGTANAMLLAGYGHDVTLWGAFPEYVEEMRKTRRNEKFLKGVTLPDNLNLESDRAKAVSGAEVVVLAAPSKYFTSVVEGFKGLITKEMLVVSRYRRSCAVGGMTTGTRSVISSPYPSSPAILHGLFVISRSLRSPRPAHRDSPAARANPGRSAPAPRGPRPAAIA